MKDVLLLPEKLDVSDGKLQKNLKVTDELNAAQKSATGLGDEVKLCSLIIDAKDTSIKVYREYPEYSFSTLVSDIGGSGIWFISYKLHG